MGNNSGHIVRAAEYEGVRVSERLHAREGFLPGHAHESLQLCFVLEGTFVETFEQARLDCVPAAILLRPAAALHQDTFQSAAVRTLLVEYFPGERFRSLFRAAQTPALLPAAAYGGLGREVRRELRSLDVASATALEAVLLQLATHVLRASGGQPVRWLAEAKRRIDEALPRRLSAGALAAELQVSRAHLFETFRRVEGKTIGEYVVQRRLEQARELLADSQAPLSEVAAVCGFADQSHFTRTFRRETGETPAGFRRRMRST